MLPTAAGRILSYLRNLYYFGNQLDRSFYFVVYFNFVFFVHNLMIKTCLLLAMLLQLSLAITQPGSLDDAGSDKLWWMRGRGRKPTTRPNHIRLSPMYSNDMYYAYNWRMPLERLTMGNWLIHLPNVGLQSSSFLSCMDGLHLAVYRTGTYLINITVDTYEPVELILLRNGQDQVANFGQVTRNKSMKDIRLAGWTIVRVQEGDYFSLVIRNTFSMFTPLSASHNSASMYCLRIA